MSVLGVLAGKLVTAPVLPITMDIMTSVETSKCGIRLCKNCLAISKLVSVTSNAIATCDFPMHTEIQQLKDRF